MQGDPPPQSICGSHERKRETGESGPLVKQGSILQKFAANLNLMDHSLGLVFWPLVPLGSNENQAVLGRAAKGQRSARNDRIWVQTCDVSSTSSKLSLKRASNQPLNSSDITTSHKSSARVCVSVHDPDQRLDDVEAGWRIWAACLWENIFLSTESDVEETRPASVP